MVGVSRPGECGVVIRPLQPDVQPQRSRTGKAREASVRQGIWRCFGGAALVRFTLDFAPERARITPSSKLVREVPTSEKIG
jgi:hypothetical protein